MGNFFEDIWNMLTHPHASEYKPSYSNQSQSGAGAADAAKMQAIARMYNGGKVSNNGMEQNKPHDTEARRAEIARSRENQQANSTPDDHYLGHKAFDAANQAALRAGFDPFTLQPLPKDPMQEYFDRMNQPFSFDPGTVDTSYIDKILAMQTAALADAHNRAQQNFNTSDANIAAMTNAYRNDILAQAPQIQAQNDRLTNNVAQSFQKTLDDNAARKAADAAQKAEMYARLGIAPAANQPDLVGQEIERGNQIAQGSRDARVAEMGQYGQSALERNQFAANAASAEGASRRADLNRRLQDIFAGLDQKGVDYQSEAAKGKQDYVSKAQGLAFDQYQKDRAFNQEEYNTLLKLKQNADIANMRYGPDSANGQKAAGQQDPTGLASLNAAQPEAAQDFQVVMQESGNDPLFNPQNLAQVAAKAKQLEAQRKIRSASNVFAYMMYLQNMQKMKSVPSMGDTTNG